jgi:hypothetical protein
MTTPDRATGRACRTASNVSHAMYEGIARRGSTATATRRQWTRSVCVSQPATHRELYADDEADVTKRADGLISEVKRRAAWERV